MEQQKRALRYWTRGIFFLFCLMYCVVMQAKAEEVPVISEPVCYEHGDVNGDGMTDDRAPETTTGTDTGTAADTMANDGISWGGILLALLAAVAVIVVAVMLIPRRRSN